MVMLVRKMIRDMLENKLAYIACIIVMALGLMTYSSMSILMENLLSAKDNFYSNYEMADAFSKVQSMPENQLNTFEKIEGIESVEGVLKQDIKVYKPEDSKTGYLRVNTYDISKDRRLNDVLLKEGYSLTENGRLIWIGEKYFKANNLKIDDNIDLIIAGKVQSFKIAGYVISPEYVYATRNQADIFPDSEHFDIAYISENLFEKLTGQNGVVTDVSFKFKEGYDYDELKPEIESKLKNYGLVKLVPLKDQSSNFMLDSELEQLINSSKSMPILFLGISSFILYIMLKRLTEMQRSQIGILKAMGYSSGQILFHYLSYALTIGLIGGILGGILGTWMSRYFTDIYKTFFSFPILMNSHTYKYSLYGILISLFFSGFAGFQGAKRILKLTPSMAMSPEAPKKAKRSSLEKVKLIWSQFTMQGRMAVRNISRSKGRSAFTVLGLMFSFSLMVVAWSYNDIVDVLIFDQFSEVKLYDMKVSYLNIQPSENVENYLYNIDGVYYVENLIELPVQIKNGVNEKTTVVIGLNNDSKMYRVLDKDGKEVNLKEDGIYLSENIANQLEVSIGDVLRVENPISDEFLLLELAGIIPQYIGSNGYANISYLENKTGFNNLTTTSYLKIDDKKQKSIRKELDKSPFVGVIEVPDESKAKINDLLDSFGYMNYVMAIISVIVGFAIVYNSSVISLSERQREFASLRVLGMSVKEVLQIVTFEQWVLGFISIILGIPLSIAMMEGVSVSYQTDVYSFPAVIGDNAFVYAVLGMIVFVVLSQINVKRKIKKLDIVEVLKERE